MSIDPNGVPIIGQQARVIIRKHRIILPNTVEVVGGLRFTGDEAAVLRVADPLNGAMWSVPLTQGQGREVLMQLAGALGIEDIHINQEN